MVSFPFMYYIKSNVLFYFLPRQLVKSVTLFIGGIYIVREIAKAEVEMSAPSPA